MSDEKRNRDLGMRCPISRRDFLNGVAVGVGGALAGDTLLSAAVIDREGDEPAKSAEYYPPALPGMRGNHDGSFTFAHRLRDGGKWDAGGPATRADGTYDLVVVSAHPR
ncbi:MAG TPA: twin-arginine translocation signal domain-containing protein, partial [Candidatus Acidoferrum sp.]